MGRQQMSKTHMFLMEFICVVLFFALCASLCVTAFVKADEISQKGLDKNTSLLVAQNIAEQVKSLDQVTEGTWEEIYSIVSEESVLLEEGKEVYVESSLEEGMLQVHIVIQDERDQEVCDLTVKKYIPEQDV